MVVGVLLRHLPRERCVAAPRVCLPFRLFCKGRPVVGGRAGRLSRRPGCVGSGIGGAGRLLRFGRFGCLQRHRRLRKLDLSLRKLGLLRRGGAAAACLLLPLRGLLLAALSLLLALWGFLALRRLLAFCGLLVPRRRGFNRLAFRDLVLGAVRDAHVVPLGGVAEVFGTEDGGGRGIDRLGVLLRESAQTRPFRLHAA